MQQRNRFLYVPETRRDYLTVSVMEPHSPHVPQRIPVVRPLFPDILYTAGKHGLQRAFARRIGPSRRLEVLKYVSALL